MQRTAPRHFSMLRDFHLADFFTLGNAACGVGAVFFAMAYMAANCPSTSSSPPRWPHRVSCWTCSMAALPGAPSALCARSRTRFPVRCDLVWRGAGGPGFCAGMPGGWDVAALVYFVCCGVSRLARYNVTAERSPARRQGELLRGHADSDQRRAHGCPGIRRMARPGRRRAVRRRVAPRSLEAASTGAAVRPLGQSDDQQHLAHPEALTPGQWARRRRWYGCSSRCRPRRSAQRSPRGSVAGIGRARRPGQTRPAAPYAAFPGGCASAAPARVGSRCRCAGPRFSTSRRRWPSGPMAPPVRPAQTPRPCWNCSGLAAKLARLSKFRLKRGLSCARHAGRASLARGRRRTRWRCPGPSAQGYALVRSLPAAPAIGARAFPLARPATSRAGPAHDAHRALCPRCRATAPVHEQRQRGDAAELVARAKRLRFIGVDLGPAHLGFQLRRRCSKAGAICRHGRATAPEVDQHRDLVELEMPLDAFIHAGGCAVNSGLWQLPAVGRFARGPPAAPGWWSGRAGRRCAARRSLCVPLQTDALRGFDRCRPPAPPPRRAPAPTAQAGVHVVEISYSSATTGKVFQHHFVPGVVRCRFQFGGKTWLTTVRNCSASTGSELRSSRRASGPARPGSC